MIAPDPADTAALVPRLRAMMQLRAAWYRALLAALADRLNRAAVPGAARVGDLMPEFVLPNTHGDLVYSADLRQQGPLVICFVRGDWCPFCTTTLSALDAIVPRLLAAGATMVALTPDTHGHGAAWQQQLGLRFDILADVDCGVAMQFGAAYRVPADYRTALLNFGTDLHARHGDGPGFLPMPATFVCDPGGVIRYAYLNGDITERAEPLVIAEIVAAIVGAG